MFNYFGKDNERYKNNMMKNKYSNFFVLVPKKMGENMVWWLKNGV
jgi:hypothetical protein